jgi:hypothetical protein
MIDCSDDLDDGEYPANTPQKSLSELLDAEGEQDLSESGQLWSELRMDRHCENAQKVAEFLESHEKVKWVSFAGLPSSSYYELGKKYCPKGTFGIHGGYEAGVELVEGC